MEDVAPDCKLVQNLFRKRELLETGDPRHEEIRPWLFFLGGGWGAGVLTAGAAYALLLLKLKQCFEIVAGISSGAGTAAYFLAGETNARLGATIFHEECASRRFFGLWRRPMADIDFMESVLRDGQKRLDLPAVLAARPRLLVAVSDWHDGSAILVDVKTARPDLITAIKASVAMPGLWDRPVWLNGRAVLDCAGSFPLRELWRGAPEPPTDILVVAGCSRVTWQNCSLSFLERIAGPWFLRRQSPAVRRVLRERFDRFHETRKFFESLEGVNVGVLFAPYDVPAYSRNSRRLRAASNDAVRAALNAFGQPRLPFQPL